MAQDTYQQSLDYLYGLEKFGMIFNLTQVERILNAIGDPHKEIQTIHIGGTNGKGSTAAMMSSILQKEGYRGEWALVAVKIGFAAYNQIKELLGPKIPTWDELAIENAEVAAMIEAEKNK